MSRLNKVQAFTHSYLRFATVIGLVLIFALIFLRLGPGQPSAQAVSANIVISQVYGGGGNSGATYKNDFIELFNHGSGAVSLNGWSVQYASAGGTTWQVTPLTNVTLQPGQYYLVQEAVGAGGTTNLPTPDATGTIAMSATSGKVALVNSAGTLSGSGCPFGASIVDYVGYGTGVSCFEGTAAPILSNTTADLRAANGCTDTDNNSTDFATSAPAPRNTATGLNACSGGGPSPSPTPTISPTPTPSPTATPVHDPSEHMVMGNPSNAVADTGVPNNYLMMKLEYALSYNNSRGIPNWTSWHLDSSWRGGAARQDDYRNDTSLPAGFHQVLQTDYSGSGFDRGHMCPSADRTSSVPDNSATFLMTNMVPQAPGNNRNPWADMENYLRTFLPGSELHIISGGQGTGGTGSNGFANTIAGGAVTVPAVTWKVVLILPAGDNDVSRVDANTRTIAVIMPNNDNVGADTWQKYLATIDQVEALTGYDLYSNVPAPVQAAIESKPDAGNDTAPVTTGQSKTTGFDLSANITLTATDFNVNNQFTYTIVNPPQHGSLSGTGASQTYTPSLHYSGPDNFTFKANDGAFDSNVSTVSITVSGGPTAAPATISGQVTNENGLPIAGVAMRLSPGNGSMAISDAGGYYILKNVDTNSVYTLTPALANYHFSPSSLSFSLAGNKTDAVFTAVADAGVTTNAIESPEFFVRQQYLDFLGREPDSSGFRYWTSQLAACGEDVDCVRGKRIDVSAAFFVEQEFQETGSFIYRAYRTAFNERPRYNQFNQDRLQVVGGGDVQVRRGAFLESFVTRSEFQQRYPASMNNDMFVEQLSNSVGADRVTRQQLKDALAAGATRAQILGRLIDLPEFKAREYNSGFVLTQYFGYLRRDPDQSGYNFWLNVLNSPNDRGGANYRGMVCSFLTSAEYQLRFSSVVTRNNNECGRIADFELRIANLR